MTKTTKELEQDYRTACDTASVVTAAAWDAAAWDAAAGAAWDAATTAYQLWQAAIKKENS